MTTQLNDLTDQTVFVTVKDCATLPFAIPGPNRVIVVRQDWSKSPPSGGQSRKMIFRP